MRRPKFVPPAPEPPEPPPPQLQLYDLPQDQILLHGEMIRDVQTIDAMLQGLPFAAEAYRGNLRVIVSLTQAIRRRCVALLGEAEPPDEPAEPSNKIDAPAAEPNNKPKSVRRGRQHHAENGAGVRQANGRPPEPAVEAEGGSFDSRLLAALQKRPRSPLELGEALGVSPEMYKVYQATSRLKKAGKIESIVQHDDGSRKWQLV